MLIDFFPTENIFFHNFQFSFSTRILVSATKLANIKIIWSKLETKEQSNKMLIYWSIQDRLVTPETESLTRHIDLLDAVTHTHLWLANLAEHKPVSTFSFSHLQRRVAYPCLKARKARRLRNTEIRAMQRKQGWKLDRSGFWKKTTTTKKTAETIIYALSLSTQNRRKKKTHGKAKWKKMLMTKRHTRTRSSDHHHLLLLTVLK